jgi:hypothetical protein
MAKLVKANTLDWVVFSLWFFVIHDVPKFLGPTRTECAGRGRRARA